MTLTVKSVTSTITLSDGTRQAVTWDVDSEEGVKKAFPEASIILLDWLEHKRLDDQEA